MLRREKIGRKRIAKRNERSLLPLIELGEEVIVRNRTMRLERRFVFQSQFISKMLRMLSFKKRVGIGTEKDVLGFGNAPNFFKDGNDFWIVFNECCAVVRRNVVFAKVGLGGFGEILHLVIH